MDSKDKEKVVKKVVYKNNEYIIETEGDNTLIINGKKFHTKVKNKSEEIFSVTIDKKQFTIEVRGSDIYLDGKKIEHYSVSPYFPTLKKQKRLLNAGKQLIKAPIAGLVSQILVKEGEYVTKDKELLILEAMKMRNRIMAEIDGKITKIYVNEGETVKQDQPLLSIEN